jgi:predicted DNA-binding transcriptional regulator AlpA
MRYAMPVKAKQSSSPVVLVPGPLVQPPVALGLSRLTAAAFVGVGVSKFDEMVKDGRMPPPHQVDRRLVWSRVELEQAFADLPYVGVQEQGVETVNEFDFT